MIETLVIKPGRDEKFEKNCIKELMQGHSLSIMDKFMIDRNLKFEVKFELSNKVVYYSPYHFRFSYEENSKLKIMQTRLINQIFFDMLMDFLKSYKKFIVCDARYAEEMYRFKINFPENNLYFLKYIENHLFFSGPPISSSSVVNVDNELFGVKVRNKKEINYIKIFRIHKENGTKKLYDKLKKISDDYKNYILKIPEKAKKFNDIKIRFNF